MKPMTYGEMKEYFDKLVVDFPALKTLEETTRIQKILDSMADHLSDSVSEEAASARDAFNKATIPIVPRGRAIINCLL